MVRVIFACCVVVLVAVSAGCRMCADPYDYCGPTFTGQGGEECGRNARAGSILSPGFEPGSSVEMLPETAIVPEAQIGTEVDVGPEMEPSPEPPVPLPDELTGPVPGVHHPVDGPHRRPPRRWAARPPRKILWR